MSKLTQFFKKYLDSPDTPLSEADAFIRQFDIDHPERSTSQLKEIAKSERIAKLRDVKPM
jgi:hypothetical protein